LFHFRDVLHTFVGYDLSEHQLITVVRRYRSGESISPSLPLDTLFSILQVSTQKTGKPTRQNYLNWYLVAVHSMSTWP
jgi:hypothetical protein